MKKVMQKKLTRTLAKYGHEKILTGSGNVLNNCDEYQ